MATRPALLLTALWAYFHVLQYGFHISALNGIQAPLTCDVLSGPAAPHVLPSPSKAGLKSCVPMTPAQFGVVTAIFTLGGLVGSLSSSTITHRLGRIGCLQVSSFCIFVGSIAVGLANTPTAMVFGRIVIGLGCGLATVTVPLITAALLPTWRGIMGILSQLAIVFGLLLGQSLSFPFAHPYKWRYVPAFSACIAVVLFLAGFVVVGEDAVEKSREREGGGNEEGRPLLEGEHEEESREEVMGIKELFTSKDVLVRRGLVVVIISQLSQQLCGISPVIYFSTRILTPVFSANSRYIALIIILLKIPFTILPTFLIRRTGSLPLLLASAVLMAISALFLALGLNLSIPIMSCAGIISFVCVFSFGLGPIAWVLLSEVMPPQSRNAAGSIGLALNWSLNFVMGASFLPLQQFLSFGKASGEGNVFYVFVATCSLAFVGIRWSYVALRKATA